MDIRKQNESREIAVKTRDIRHAADMTFRGSRSIVRTGTRGIGSTIRFGKNTVKRMLLTRDERKSLSYLTNEQRRQWKSYSHREQKKILQAADKKVQRRMRMNGASGVTGVPAPPTGGYSTKDRYYNLGHALHDELNQLANNGHRYIIPAREYRKGKEIRRKPEMIIYASTMKKGRKSVARVEKKQLREIRKEIKKEKKLHRTAITELIDRDRQKIANIKNQQRQQQVEISQYEQELKSDIVRKVTFLPRLKMEQIKVRTLDLLRTTFAKLAKYLLIIFGPALLALLLILTLVSIISAITGQDSGSSATGYAIVEYAKTFIGKTRYVWGAGRNGPNDWQDYADCSSFVQGVYGHFDIRLGSTTYVMENDGTVIRGGLENAIPGDIILFYSGSIAKGNSQHVAIYAGEGRMIHCSGGSANYDAAHAGRGVCWGSPNGDGRPYEIRRVLKDVIAGAGTGGHRVDATRYSQQQKELIWAIVAQEDNGSYEGALAVISTAMNRVDSPSWRSYGRNALQQLTAPGQFCYSIDNYWRNRLNGNVPEYVKKAVSDCLQRGIRNHNYTCFRSTKGSQTGADAVQIGGNWFFGH